MRANQWYTGFDPLVATRQQATGQAPASHLDTPYSPSSSQLGDDNIAPLPLRRLNRPTTTTGNQTHYDPWLHARLRECPGEGNLHGPIRREEDFHAVLERYSTLTHHKPVGPTPAEDATMPTTDHMKAHYVDRLLNSITDFSDTETAGASTSQMIEGVARVKLSLVELNLLCWQVLVSLLLWRPCLIVPVH